MSFHQALFPHSRLEYAGRRHQKPSRNRSCRSPRHWRTRSARTTVYCTAIGMCWDVAGSSSILRQPRPVDAGCRRRRSSWTFFLSEQFRYNLKSSSSLTHQTCCESLLTHFLFANFSIHWLIRSSAPPTDKSQRTYYSSNVTKLELLLMMFFNVRLLKNNLKSISHSFSNQF